MDIEEFAEGIAAICSRTLIAPGRTLFWTIIANPTAGGFTINPRWMGHRGTLKAYVEKAKANPVREKAGPSRTAREGDTASGFLGHQGLLPTEGPGHARRIVNALIEEAEFSYRAAAYDKTAAGLNSTDSTSPGLNCPFHLIITAGGDGTSLDAMTSLFAAPEDIRSNFAVLRLPMGTGNDGADGWELSDALDLLINPVEITWQRALRLSTATPGKGPFLAFNILSVGLDAFVTHMTNKMKGKLPGDSYKLWVDIASLLYDRIYKVGPMEIRAYGEGGDLVKDLEEITLLLAVGVSGHRTYGSHKRILPDERNVCLVRQMPLLRKLALKELFTLGKHVDKPESILFNASRVEFRGKENILAQMDGETVALTPADFPASIELSEPAIPVLKRIPL
jgi:diacylglycerol kinase family enzyme